MTADHTERNKEVVRRLVDDVINHWRIDELAEIFTAKAAGRARDDFASFREAFPDWQMELLEMVAEDDSVVARFICHGTHHGAWRGDAPTGKVMAVDEVFFFRFQDGLISDVVSRRHAEADRDAAFGPAQNREGPGAVGS